MAKKAKAAKSQDVGLYVRDDPRVRDPVIFNRIKLMVEHEACHPAWGCVLYQLHRLGLLTNEQKEAGDLYQQIVYNYKRCQDVDPHDLPVEAQELWERRIERAKSKWNLAVELLGLKRSIIDNVVIENNQPVGEREKLIVRDGLQLIANFFGRRKNGLATR